MLEVMPDDPVSQLVPASPDDVMSEAPNRSEPNPDLSESASSQPVQEQPASSPQPASEPQPVQTIEPSQAPFPPSSESISTSTPSPSEPSGTIPPAQDVPPETESEKQETQTVQVNTAPQGNPEPEPAQPETPKATQPASVETPPLSSNPPNPPTPSISSIPSLHFPFYSEYPVTFEFGAQSTDEDIKKKYQEWGLVGHNGLDFGLPEGTEVLSCDDGIVTQVGENGDFGISVTIKHAWGTSIYGHLLSFAVLVNDHVTKTQVIGASDHTGFVKGAHLHFGIQPTNPDTNNGYLGYINPSQYLMEHSEKPQPKPSQTEQQPEPQILPDLSEQKPIELPPDLVAQSPDPQSLLPAEVSTEAGVQAPSPQPPLAPQVPHEKIEKQAVALFDARRKENSIKGNEVKKAKRDEALQKIFMVAQAKKRITNQQIRDLLHISQSTATDYLSSLVNRGMLKTEGKGKATVYLF